MADDTSDINPDRTMTVEGRQYRERTGKAIGAALAQCGIRVQYAIAGPTELWDVADLVIRAMPSTRGALPDSNPEYEHGIALSDLCLYATTHAEKDLFPSREYDGLCSVCGGPGEFFNSPTGSWWAHLKHPTDGHDFQPREHFGIDNAP